MGRAKQFTRTIIITRNLELQSDNIFIDNSKERKISQFDENQVSSNYDCSSKLFCSSKFKNVTANDCSEVIKQTVPNQISINSTNLGQKKGGIDTNLIRNCLFNNLRTIIGCYPM